MSPAMSPNREKTILDLWERAAGLDRWKRDDALLAEEGAAPRGLGARNIGLLSIRTFLFGRFWKLRSNCSNCGTEIEFEVNGAALAQDLPRAATAGVAVLDWGGGTVVARAPTVDDLIAVATRHDTRQAVVRALVERCTEGTVEALELTEAAVEEFGDRLEQLDPAAIVGFDVVCPVCNHGWPATLDIGDALWIELRYAAERTLVEIDALARAYGWSEDEILRLSPVRRAAYLQLVEAA
ncbi:MAG: hypothetical protein JSS04_05010 [Proteobacteria bacterium]|nr:hypothetical protein [Pseudomonadota bacterium]